jgi:hypothetical protein
MMLLGSVSWLVLGSSAASSADEAEDKAVAFVESLHGRVARDENTKHQLSCPGPHRPQSVGSGWSNRRFTKKKRESAEKARSTAAHLESISITDPLHSRRNPQTHFSNRP